MYTLVHYTPASASPFHGSDIGGPSDTLPTRRCHSSGSSKRHSETVDTDDVCSMSRWSELGRQSRADATSLSFSFFPPSQGTHSFCACDTVHEWMTSAANKTPGLATALS